MEMGVFRDVFHDTGDGQQHVAVVGDNGLPHGIFFAEVFPGRIFADHHGVRRFEGAVRVAPDERKGKDVEQLFIDPVHVLFIVNPVFVLHDPGAERGKHPGEVPDFGEVGLQHGTQFAGRPGAVVERYPVDAVGLFVVAVVAQLVAHVQEDQDGADHAHGQTEDVYRGISSLAAHVPQRDGDLVTEHHSLRNTSAGLASAVRVTWYPMVNTVISRARPPARKKTLQPTSVRYA